MRTVTPLSVILLALLLHFIAKPAELLAGPGSLPATPVTIPVVGFWPDTIKANFTSCNASGVYPLKIYNTGGASLNFAMSQVSNFFEDFENGLENWEYNGYWGTSTDAYTGSGALDDYPYNYYYNYANQTITLKDSLLVQNPDSCYLKFWLRRYMECCCDYLRPQISVNGGDWITLSSYNCNNNWQEVVINMSSYVAMGDLLRFRFVFTSDYSVVGQGVNIDNLYIGGIGASSNLLSFSPDAGNILAGDSATVNITINTQGLNSGIYYILAIINSNDPLNPSLSVPIEVTIQGVPEILIDSAVFTMPSVMAYMTTTKSIWIKNLGCDTLFIDTIISSNPVFIPQSTDFWIRPHDSASFTLQFAPTAAGDQSATLVFYNNDSDVTVMVNGLATPPPVIAVSPDSFNFSLTDCDEVYTATLTFYNNGLMPLYGDLGSSLSSTNITPPVCQPDNTANCDGRGIIRVKLNTIDNESSNGCAGFENFDTIFTQLEAGNEYNLTVQTGTGSENVRVWIDYNADQLFDPVSELIFYSQYNSFHSNYFIVPNGLPAGVPMRMRVMSDYYYSPSFTSCTNPVYGQAEDYTIYIQSDIPQITPGSFEIPAGDSSQISVVFQANQLWSGQYQGSIFAMSNDPLNPIISIPFQFSLSGPAQIELSTLSMNYPDILQYTCHLDSFLVSNTGCDSLFVTDIITPGPEYSVNSSTFMLLPGSSKYVNVLFCSEVTGFYDGTIQVQNNVANGEIYISCNVLGAPMIQVNPDSLSAVINSCGDSLTLPITIYNPGTDTLTYEFIPVSNFFEDFENGLDKWNYTGYWGISADAYEGNGSLDEYPNYSYFNSMSQYITLKDSLLIQEPDSCIVKFWFRRYMECCCDYLEPQIQVNGGSWVSLSGYNCNNDWEYINLSIAAYVSPGDYLKFRFWFHSDYSAIGSGVNIDNLYIGGLGSSIITNTGTGATWLSISPDSANVLPGDSTLVNFTFYSQNVPGGLHFQIVNLFSNSPLTPIITFPVLLEVNGQAVASAQPDHLNFPSTMEMMESSQSFSMMNMGCDTLFVDSILNPSVHFRVEPLPVYVLPYQSVNMQAIFSPQDTGTYQYQMVLASNIGVINLWFEGEATGAPDAGIDPDTLVVTLTSCDETQIIPLTLSNSGLVNLDWSANADFSFAENKALLYNGYDDYTSLGYWTPGSQWTLEAWVKPSDLPAGRKTIIGGLYNCVDYAICLQDGQFGVAIRPPGGCSQTILSPDVVVAGQWYHISATNDGSVAKLYVNGVLMNQGPVDPNYVGFYYSYIGYEYCCGNPFQGMIDEVRVWNYPRSANEINSWMHRLLQGNESGLFAYYQLDDGTGSFVNDLSIHNYNGTTYYTEWVDSDAPINDFLQINPIAGSVIPGSSAQIDLEISSIHLLSGTYQGDILINTNDPVHGVIHVPITIIIDGQPEVSLSDSCLNYGSILQYDSKLDTLYITNTGCDTLFISGISPTSTAFTTNVSHVVLAPGNQVLVSVLFNPAAIGTYTDTLWINSNDGVHWICLSGEATPRPNMVVSSLIFQDTLICEVNGTQSLVIKNTGVIPLEYTIPLVAQTWLTITPHTGLLLTGDSAIHQITYSKVDLPVGIHEGHIIINSNDPLNSPKDISVQMNILNAYHPLSLGPDVHKCIGEAVTLNAGSGYETYLWSTGSTNNSITVSVPGVYSLVVKDFTYDCYFYDTIDVSWHAYPTVNAGNDTTICQGKDYTFHPQFQNLLPVSPSICQVGTGTSVTSNVGPSPFGTYYMDDRTQMLYKASELTASGLSPGGITAIALNVFGIGSPAMQGLTIRMGHTSLNSLTGFVTTNDVVLTLSSYSPVSGWNALSFTTPFYWNGVQNIVIEVCFNNNSYISSSGVQYSTVPNSVWSSWCDNCAPGCSLGGGNSFSERANIKFYGSGDPSYYTWNGPNGYISHMRNAIIHTVGFQNAGFYYVTVDNSYGCTDKDTVIVAVNPSPVASASNDVSLVYGTNTQLDVTVTAGIPPFVYQWSPATALSNPSIANPIASPNTTTTYTIKVTSQNLCSDEDNVIVTVLPIYQINGTLTYKNPVGTPLNGLSVYLKGPGGVILDSSITDGGGSYLFDELVNKTYTYSVVCSKPWGGGNATDALLVAKHIVFLYSLTGLNLTAADVNNSGTLSSADPLLILRRSVGAISSFPAGEWLFTNTDIIINNANVTHPIQGLCFGDVNGTLVPGSKSPPLVMLTESGTAAVPQDRIFDLAVRCGEAIHAGAITLGFTLSDDIEEVIDVGKAIEGLEWNIMEGNILRIAWENTEGMEVEPGDLLLDIKLKLHKDAKFQSPLLSLEGDCEIADPEARVLGGVQLMIPRLKPVSAYAELFAEAIPNPFVDDVNLVYDIPEDGIISIRLYDVYGRLLQEVLNAEQVSGQYKIRLTGETLPAGLYQLELRHMSGGNMLSKTLSIVKTH